jgi:cyanophycinase
VKICLRFLGQYALAGVLLARMPAGLPAEEPGSADLEPASPVSGSLVICGGGQLPEPVMNEFVQLAGGEQARIVVIPTASATADTPEVEAKLQFWRQLKLATFSVLHTRSRAVADDPAFSQPLHNATGVWFTGGFQWRLADTYLNTTVEKLVHQVLDRGGVVGGTSSGAAVMSPLMIRRANEVGPGFGLLPGTVIDQHFIKRNRQDRLLDVLTAHPGFVGLGIDEGTAIVAQGRRLRVIGDSQVVACLASSADRPTKMQVLRSGDEADLIALSRAAIERAQPHRAARVEYPALTGGTLIIAGGGRLPAEVPQRFLAAAGGPDAPLVIVSTALGDGPPPEGELVDWLRQAGARRVARVHALDQEEAGRPEVLAALAAARGIWFTGGRQWRLVDAYLDTPAQKAFQRVLERGGVIGGSSAGATITAGYLVRGNPLSTDDMMVEGYDRGFGFLPGTAVDHHFSQRNRFADMALLKRTRPELVGLGIDEETAAIVSGHEMEVVGTHRVALYEREARSADQPPYRLLTSGTRYDFKTQRLVEPPARSATRAEKPGPRTVAGSAVPPID